MEEMVCKEEMIIRGGGTQNGHKRVESKPGPRPLATPCAAQSCDLKSSVCVSMDYEFPEGWGLV